jgi:hypothetical protein
MDGTLFIRREIAMKRAFLMPWVCFALQTILMNCPAFAQDSLGMHHVATLDYWQGASDIQMVGNLAYVFSGESGLHIVDLTDPANPVEIGRGTWYDWYSPWGGIYVTGNRAYVASTQGCCAFDISDPTQPVQLARWWEDRSQLDIFVHDTIAIIQIEQEYGSTPVVADISDLGNVQQIGDFGGRIMWPIGMVEDYLCMANSEGGVLVFDISNPSQPVEVAQVDTTMPGGLGTIVEDYAYFGTFYDGLRIIDISNPLQPVEVASCDSGWCCNHTVINAHLVVSRDNGCIDIWNVSDPVHPILEGMLPSLPEFMEISGSGNLICLAYYNNPFSVAVVDISNPAAPIQVSSFGLIGFLGWMKTYGATGYIAGAAFPGSGSRGFCITDLANPINPLFLGIIHSPGSDLAIHGNYAYIPDRNSGLRVFDVSNPAEPESLHCTPGGCPQKIIVVGDYAYVVETDQGTWVSLFTYNLQEPAVPVRVDSLHIPYYTMGDAFGAQNGYLYIGASYSSAYLFVYSLANPAAPQLVGTTNWSNVYGCVPIDLELTDQYAYVADYTGGLATIDITQPENPVVVAQMEGTTICEVAAIGDTIVTDGNSRINVRDMTDPTDPRTVGYYPTLEIIRDINTLGSYVITISSSELRVYQCDTISATPKPLEVVPNKFDLYPCYPNPFNASTVISYCVPHQSKLCLDIYNILGQRITTLYNGTRIAGQHRVIWDASDIASGIYFCRMSAPGFQSFRKMVLIK